MNYIPLIFPIITIMGLCLYFIWYARLPHTSDLTAEGEAMDTPPARPFSMPRHTLDKRDALPLILITAVYAVVAFIGLGDTEAPVNYCSYSDSGYYTDIEFREPTTISRIMYFSALHTGNYYVQLSMDGETWSDVGKMEQGYNSLFKWNSANDLALPGTAVRHMRLIADARLDLGELALFDENDRLITIEEMSFDSGASTLFDEQELVPEKQTYMNSTYFDEIYHPRTALEHIENVYPYEVSHPPLGKLIISLGIRIFGMTPFGWRFMGVLFGILMVPIIYVFIKRMFGSRAVAIAGSVIFAFDFMHYVQTRIATIDTYAVIFIMLSYLFMYRWLCADPDDPDTKKRDLYLPLFLSGLFWGIGAASKWTVIYSGLGLALIWLIRWILRYRTLKKSDRAKEFTGELGPNILWCVLFFVVIPALIYYVSYYAYGTAKGFNNDSEGGVIGMLFSNDYAQLVIDNQKFMFSYHKGVTSEHPYSSQWYQWIVNARPILYYLDSDVEGTRAAFAAFLNPALCWGGLFSMFSMGYLTVTKKDGKALFILIGYLSALVPWMFITRPTFEYHYFPCVIFLTLALCHIFSTIEKSGRKKWKRAVYGYAAVTVFLFVMFYPVLSGITVPRWYPEYFLRWIPGAWPF